MCSLNPGLASHFPSTPLLPCPGKQQNLGTPRAAASLSLGSCIVIQRSATARLGQGSTLCTTPTARMASLRLMLQRFFPKHLPASEPPSSRRVINVFNRRPSPIFRGDGAWPTDIIACPMVPTRPHPAVPRSDRHEALYPAISNTILRILTSLKGPLSGSSSYSSRIACLF